MLSLSVLCLLRMLSEMTSKISGNPAATGITVGVTISIRDNTQSLWENGIFQNCMFLVKLLRLIPEVSDAVLVHGPNITSIPDGLMLSQTDIRIISQNDALSRLDVIIEMSDQVSEDWALRFKQLGGRLVAMKVGNEYFIDSERAIYNLPHAGLWGRKPYDAIWTLPEYKSSCVDYYSICGRAPALILPHIWSPQFLDIGIDSLPDGVVFGYQEGARRWSVSCFEPNLSLVKTSVIPLLACEEAYRNKPRAFNAFHLCNTSKSLELQAFHRFVETLDIARNGLCTFSDRHYFYEHMAIHGGCVISHQWHNSQNYLYYEALYGGYPLIHNSPILANVGYYYPDFNTRLAGQALVDAYVVHDQSLDDYQSKADDFLETLDPAYPANIQAYRAALLSLYPQGVCPKPTSVYEPAVKPAHIDGVDQIWLINLQSRSDLLEHFDQMHPEMFGRINYFDAFDGADLVLTPQLARLFRPNKSKWHKSTISSILSHLSLWIRLASEPDPSTTYLILQDDVELLPSWQLKLEKALQSRGAVSDWEIIFLGCALSGALKEPKYSISLIGPGFASIRNQHDAGDDHAGYLDSCAHAYLLNVAGARRMLDQIIGDDGLQVQEDFFTRSSFAQIASSRPVYCFHPSLAFCSSGNQSEYARLSLEEAVTRLVGDDNISGCEDACFTLDEVNSVASSSLPLDMSSLDTYRRRP
jgi:hypothetical protein